ncbi:chorismate mutase [Actinomadura gamaensis]|uniref:Chorismate mutase n=1 Tax=Actinomadura gamaensis TaxID=1763541 RepID=A0ABV9TWE5_9ACTN
MPDARVVKVGSAVFGSDAPTVIAALPEAASAAPLRAAAQAARAAGADILATVAMAPSAAVWAGPSVPTRPGVPAGADVQAGGDVLADAGVLAEPGVPPGAGVPAEADVQAAGDVLPDAGVSAEPGVPPGAGVPAGPGVQVGGDVLPDADVLTGGGVLPGESVPAGASVLAGAPAHGATSAAVLGRVAREAGLPLMVAVSSPEDVRNALPWADLLSVAAPGPELVRAVAATGLPVLLTGKPGDDPSAEEFDEAVRNLADAGIGEVVLGLGATGAAEAWAVRERTGRPVILDLRGPRVDAGLLAPLSLTAAGVGADGVLAQITEDGGVSAADVPALASVLPLLLTTAGPPADAAPPPNATAAPAAEVPAVAASAQPGEVAPDGAGFGLAAVRSRMRLLDAQIVQLVAHRRSLARLAGEVKRRARVPVRDLRQEVRVLERAERLAQRLDADPHTVVAIFNLLIDDAVFVQRPYQASLRAESART